MKCMDSMVCSVGKQLTGWFVVARANHIETMPAMVILFSVFTGCVFKLEYPTVLLLFRRPFGFLVRQPDGSETMVENWIRIVIV